MWSSSLFISSSIFYIIQLLILYSATELFHRPIPLLFKSWSSISRTISLLFHSLLRRVQRKVERRNTSRESNSRLNFPPVIWLGKQCPCWSHKAPMVSVCPRAFTAPRGSNAMRRRSKIHASESRPMAPLCPPNCPLRSKSVYTGCDWGKTPTVGPKRISRHVIWPLAISTYRGVDADVRVLTRCVIVSVKCRRIWMTPPSDEACPLADCSISYWCWQVAVDIALTVYGCCGC